MHGWMFRGGETQNVISLFNNDCHHRKLTILLLVIQLKLFATPPLMSVVMCITNSRT